MRAERASIRRLGNSLFRCSSVNSSKGVLSASHVTVFPRIDAPDYSMAVTMDSSADTDLH